MSGDLLARLCYFNLPNDVCGTTNLLENLVKVKDGGGDSHIGRDITTLSLNDGESGQGATAKVVVHLCCTLEQA